MYYRLISKYMYYRLADQLCAVEGHTYNLSTVTHLVYLYLVLGQYIHSVEIPMSTSTQFTPGFTYREFTTYNAAFIDLEVNLIEYRSLTKAHSTGSCALK